MAYRVLPALLVQLVVRILARYERVDLAERELLLARRRDGLRDQLRVRVRRLLVQLNLARGARCRAGCCRRVWCRRHCCRVLLFFLLLLLLLLL